MFGGVGERNIGGKKRKEKFGASRFVHQENLTPMGRDPPKEEEERKGGLSYNTLTEKRGGNSGGNSSRSGNQSTKRGTWEFVELEGHARTLLWGVCRTEKGKWL